MFIKKALIYGMVVFLSCLPVLWQTGSLYASGPGTTGAEFLKIRIGARASALAGAFTAISDDVNGLFWNPAGLSQERRQGSLRFQS